MPTQETEWVYQDFIEEVSLSVKTLLEKKHLYQSVTVDSKNIESTIDNLKFSSKAGDAAYRENIYKEDCKKVLFELPKWYWTFGTGVNPGQAGMGNKMVALHRLPNIQVACSQCEADKPAHTSGFTKMENNPSTQHVADGSNGRIEIYFLPYQCQACEGEPVIFMVRRDGLELKLVGRTQFERTDVPQCIRKLPERKFYREAIIASNVGRDLAGLFFLRTMIEQYMRRITGEDGFIRGEDLARIYQKYLPEGFPANLKTLGKIYDELSNPLHAAEAEESQLNLSIHDIQAHFRQLDILPLRKEPLT